MGVYAPVRSNPRWATRTYAMKKYSDGVKWIDVVRIKNATGSYSFQTYAIVGSLDDVRADMLHLHSLLN